MSECPEPTCYAWLANPDRQPRPTPGAPPHWPQPETVEPGDDEIPSPMCTSPCALWQSTIEISSDRDALWCMERDREREQGRSWCYAHRVWEPDAQLIDFPVSGDWAHYYAHRGMAEHRDWMDAPSPETAQERAAREHVERLLADGADDMTIGMALAVPPSQPQPQPRTQPVAPARSIIAAYRQRS